MADQSNPLLDLTGLPRFEEIRPEHVEPALDHLLAENRAALETLLAQDGPATWDRIIQPLEDMDERLERMWSPVSHLNAVMDSPQLRAVYNTCLPKLVAYGTEVSQDERVYAAFKAVAADAGFGALTPAQRKIVTNALRDFRLAGAELDTKDKTRYRAVRQELSALGSRFEQNALDATDAFELLITERAQLAGLPESALAMARQEAERAGADGWKFTLDAPSYIPFMRYAENRELRRRMYEAFVCRASDQGPQAGRWDNAPVIERILELRREMAQLLGYPNYAEYSLETKMASDTGEVTAFLEDLARRSRPAAESELDEVRRFARDTDGAQALESWDIPYYTEKLRQQRYAFSQEDVRPYFPLQRVLAGMFEVVRRLYGLAVAEVPPPQRWHPDVKFFEIRDEQDILRGRFYLDVFARSHKRGGAWMDECIPRKRVDGRVQVPVAYLTCNFTPPVGDTPSLLTHDEVITLFHEFGHGLHHMLTQVDYVGVAGISGVAWDAVELPSQFMENWCWEKETLSFLSGHYRTGEPLPDALLDKMRAARNFLAGMDMVRQLEFALFDMRLHSEYPGPAGESVQAVLDGVRAEVAVVTPPAFNRFQNGFTHIFGGGYAAGYYSYKWAEVLSADAFSKFEENGIFDRTTGLEFLHSVLEQGGTREPLELFVEFRGRKPQIEPLLRHTGLAA